MEGRCRIAGLPWAMARIIKTLLQNSRGQSPSILTATRSHHTSMKQIGGRGSPCGNGDGAASDGLSRPSHFFDICITSRQIAIFSWTWRDLHAKMAPENQLPRFLERERCRHRRTRSPGAVGLAAMSGRPSRWALRPIEAVDNACAVQSSTLGARLAAARRVERRP